MVTDINSEDSLVQATFARHLEQHLGWESIYAWNQETFGLAGTLGRTDTREVVLTRDLRSALFRLNPQLPPMATRQAQSRRRLGRSFFASLTLCLRSLTGQPCRIAQSRMRS